MLMIECPEVVNSIMNEFFLADRGDFPLQAKHQKPATKTTSAPESPFEFQVATDCSEMSNGPEVAHLESTSSQAEHPDEEPGAGVEGRATKLAGLEPLEVLEVLESAGHSTQTTVGLSKATEALPVEKQIPAGLVGNCGGASVC